MIQICYNVFLKRKYDKMLNIYINKLVGQGYHMIRGIMIQVRH